MPAIFQYGRVMRMARDTFADSELRFFGNVVSGAFSLTDTVFVPVLGRDPIGTTIGRFTDDFTDDWCGMPFYDTVRADSVGEPFCVCVDGSPLVGCLIASPSQFIVR